MAVAWLFQLSHNLWAQELNSYRTTASGLFNNISIWQVFDGSNWVSASAIPNSSNDIYINQTHTLSLTTNQAVKSLFINSETGAGQKLLLNGNALEIYGTLQAFTGTAPGTPTAAWNSQNWIGNSIDSRLVFRGISRVIVPRGAWSGFSTNSRYSIIFDPGAGQTLIVEEPIKSMRFIIRSGTVVQTLDTSVVPSRCNTFSFNTENLFGTDEFGQFVIENGGTFLSPCNSDILFRSTTRSAELLQVNDGGEIILEGSNPRIEVTRYELNGKLTFANGSSTKNFLSRSFPSSVNPTQIHDLEIRSTQNLTIPSSLSVSGDLIQSSTGVLNFSGSDLTFNGAANQSVIGFNLIVPNLTLDKTGGEVSYLGPVSVLSTLSLLGGGMNLNGNDLHINILGLGGVNYVNGYWRNLGELNYFNIPTTLNTTNFTLPFLDQFQGGVRKIQILGNSPGGNLQVRLTEYKGADFDPQFQDNDGTAILYRLFSHFNFSGITPSSDPIELRISASNLIVDQVDDLRIVATGYAAPGTHLAGLDPILLWARRNLTFGDLAIGNFTIGSYRVLSVLPVSWLEVKATQHEEEVELNWKVASETNNSHFEIYRSEQNIHSWELLGTVQSSGDSQDMQEYSFWDFSKPNFKTSYYRIRQVDFDGAHSWSDVVRVDARPVHELILSPNPHLTGRVTVSLPNHTSDTPLELRVLRLDGAAIFHGEGSLTQLETILQDLKPGVYGVQLITDGTVYFSRFVKK
ncbi:hypothetical protein [Algoriphagus namhaensis]